MFVGFRSRSHFLTIFTAGAAFAAFAPGCSSSTPATAQAGIVWQIQVGDNSSATCPVDGADTFTIGGGNGNDDSTVPDNGTTNGTPVSINCQVSGNSSSGYNLYLYAGYGTGPYASLTVQGHVDGTTNAQPNITGLFNDSLPQGTTANLAETTCTITYPDTNEGMGIAAGRIWGYIDCPTATDANRGHVCDANATFRFENCSQ